MKFKPRLRLENFSYKGYFKYFVTICTFQKQKLFLLNDTNVFPLIDILKETANKYQFKIWVYVFMPEHLHLLVEGNSVNSDFQKFIAVYKQKGGFKFWHEKRVHLWQDNYYEHVLRKEEDNLGIVKYILNNPVRKGLVENYQDYKYSGSLMLDIRNAMF